MACFADISVLQSSVAAYARWGWSFNIHLTTKFDQNFSSENFNRFRFDRIMVMSLWPTFLAHPVHCVSKTSPQLTARIAARSVDTSSCYARLGVPWSVFESVCLSVRLLVTVVSRADTKRLNRSQCTCGQTSVGPENHYYMGINIDATWQIQLSDLCGADNVGCRCLCCNSLLLQQRTFSTNIVTVPTKANLRVRT